LLADLFVDRPITILLIGYSLLIVATICAFYFDYFKMEEPGNPREFLIWNHPLVEDWDMQTLAKRYIEKFLGGSSAKQLQTQYD
jgi:hypothetical protein